MVRVESLKDAHAVLLQVANPLKVLPSTCIGYTPALLENTLAHFHIHF